MWGGRFSAAPAEAFHRLNRSLPVDFRLWPQDVRASAAWVTALNAAGILDAREADQLSGGLERVARRFQDGAGGTENDEDVHTLVERLLYEEVGEVAGKLHTGRSRNDQVVTDLRLWCLDALSAVDQEVAALGRALTEQAHAAVDLIMPGYTHGQRAQPIRFGFLLLAHAWPLVRDRQRIADARRRTAVLPLGSGALAGSGVRVDRRLLGEALGFPAISENALDATGDRDFVADILYTLTMIATHISRLGGELVTFSGSECGFIRLADSYASGSSLMPQKRNPDVFELARAKPARILGHLVSLLATLKGLPAGYSKDLQEDKSALFSATDDLLLTLPAVRGAVESLAANPDRMRAALDSAMLATDLADGLVQRGVPFREAHHLVGRLVRLAEDRGIPLERVTESDSRGVHPELPGLIGSLGTWEDSVERRATAGGASRQSVLDQIAALRENFAAG